MRKLLVALVLVLLICGSAQAGPFVIFGGRKTTQIQDCPNGNCARPTQTYSFQQSSVTVSETKAPEPKPKTDALPKRITINGIIYEQVKH